MIIKPFRYLSLFACFAFISLFLLRVHSHILLDDVMCKEDQINTGVAHLSQKQRLALEQWLNKNFTLKEDKSASGEPVYLSLNFGGGKILQLSDGSYYQVAPDDVINASQWIIPFEVVLTESGNKEFPILFHNMTSGTAVEVKSLSEEEVKELLNKLLPEAKTTPPKTAPLPPQQSEELLPPLPLDETEQPPKPNKK